MYERLLRNHVLTNLTFILVLAVGALSYKLLPRQQDPTINFNWIVITTILPGASALDVEKKVTDPLEDAIRGISDIKFVNSNSRQSVSSILVRFEQIDERIFDKRVADLRREIQNAEDELPAEAEDSLILEITSSNAFPSATIAVVGQANDENLRTQARNVEKDIERLKGVDRADPVGNSDPELHVVFDPALLDALAIAPAQVADTVSAYFRDIAAGTVRIENQNWLVRLVGSDDDPAHLANRPILGAAGEVRLGEVARVQRAREKPATLTRFEGRPAVLMAIMKKENANTLDLVERLKAYMEQRNALAASTGVDLVLIDDQTIPTRQSISLMQNNAMIGLVLVLGVTWVFLGAHIAFLTAIGIPFILAATFWILSAIGETLNVTVLLGVVIVLGMLVDDAVVVVEAIYYRLRRGADALSASIASLREVAMPVTTAVLTTMAAFLPLMLLPGILGQFMRVIPMVVTIALAISLIEAFWMLPGHVIAAKVKFDNPSRIQLMRERFTHWIQISYVRGLVKAMRRPRLVLIGVFLLFLASIAIPASGLVKMDFFASDTLRLFYVNVEMPPSTPLDETLAKVEEIEVKVRRHLVEDETRAVLSYAGNMFTETEPRLGDQYGQILVGLRPKTAGRRDVDEIIEAMRSEVMATAGPVQISFLRLAGGPPTSKPISIKVRGDDYGEIQTATTALRRIFATIPEIIDIEDDASRGRSELVLSLDEDAVNRSGINPMEIHRTLSLLADGLVVADMRDAGEKLEVRVKGPDRPLRDIGDFLELRLPLPGGGNIPLAELVHEQRKEGLGNIRHYDFRRAITLEADLKPDTLDTVAANQLIMDAWRKIQPEHPNINLDTSGQLDDVFEAMDNIILLMFVGVGLMYLVIGTQFHSYWQPLMILTTVPMAFIGVMLGLLITRNPMSLFTLYGVVALAGIAVNAAIVLISAANARLEAGMSVLHATLYAARRRVIPILITSLTTIAGLFSLATGLGGRSLIWGPVATAIVWGLGFSTVLTLIVVPLLFRLSMGRSPRAKHAHPSPDTAG